METYYNLLNYKLCNETSMKYLGNDFLIDLPLDNLYCIDMEDLNMGGSWNSDFVNYIRLDLNLCKDGMNYDESNINCTSRDYLNSQFGENNNWFFQLLHPTVQFQPNNKTMPILVLYTSYYYGLSTSSNKVDRVYLQEHIFEDEQGWVLDKITNITFWGVSSIKSDHYANGDRDIFRYGSTSRLYSLKLYLDYGTVYYTRKYKKLFEILSEILPIIKGISAFFSFISKAINKLKVAKKINEYIIGNEINLFKSKNFKDNVNNKRILSNIKFSYNKINKKLNDMNGGPPITKKNFKSELKDSSQMMCLPKNNLFLNNNKNITEIKSKNNINKSKKRIKNISIIHFLNTKPINNTININIMNSNIFDIFNKKTPNFPLSYYLFGFLLNKVSTKKYSNYTCISKKFDISFTFFTHLIDIFSYVTLHQQFESLKKIILDEIKSKKSKSNENGRKYSIKNNNLKVCSEKIYRNMTFEY